MAEVKGFGLEVIRQREPFTPKPWLLEWLVVRAAPQEGPDVTYWGEGSPTRTVALSSLG